MQRARIPRLMRIRWNTEHVRFLQSQRDAFKARALMILRFIAEAGVTGVQRIVREVCRVRRSSSQVNTPAPEVGWGMPRVVPVDSKEMTEKSH